LEEKNEKKAGQGTVGEGTIHGKTMGGGVRGSGRGRAPISEKEEETGGMENWA